MFPFAMSRVCGAVFITAIVLRFCPAHAAIPDYKLGDTAEFDVIAPIPVVVVNPEATDALKLQVARDIPLVVRHGPQILAQAEAAMRESIASVRRDFRTNVQLPDIETQSFDRVVGQIAPSAAKDFPFARFAPLWLRGEPDEGVVNSLVQALHGVLVRPIIDRQTDTPFPESVRLIEVKDLGVAPAPAELASRGHVMATEKVLSLEEARRLAVAGFPGDEQMGRYVASFVRVNAAPDPSATELLRQKAIEGLIVNESYQVGQVVVRQGQTVDRKALNALAALREKYMIGMLQNKLEQEQSRLAREQVLATQIKSQTKWIGGGLAAVGLALALILHRLRGKPSTALVPLSPNGSNNPGAPPEGDAASWRSRALAAEDRADRAHEALRAGVVGLMRDKVVRSLADQRAELLDVHMKAEAEMRELEQRLEQLHAPLQERIHAYEQRIEELERDLAAKGEQNRELIGARIDVARQHLKLQRERVRVKLQ